MIYDVFTKSAHNLQMELLVTVICLDLILGVLRAIREHRFNSSVGIDGAIRKVAMIVSACVLMATDYLVQIDLIGFMPESYRVLLGITKIGMSELFCLMFILCESISVLKNMVLCGLPVPNGIRKWLETFLKAMTGEIHPE